MNAIKITDNLLTKSELKQIHHYFLAGQNDAITWRWNPVITGKDSLPDEGGQFCHGFFYDNHGIDNQENWKKIFPVLSAVLHNNKESKYTDINWQRVKANLNPRTVENKQLGQYHSDYGFDCETAIFYVNTNNGWTQFEDGTKVNSVANRLVTFPSHMKHVGFSCTDQEVRVVINLNYIRWS